MGIISLPQEERLDTSFSKGYHHIHDTVWVMDWWAYHTIQEEILLWCGYVPLTTHEVQRMLRYNHISNLNFQICPLKF